MKTKHLDDFVVRVRSLLEWHRSHHAKDNSCPPAITASKHDFPYFSIVQKATPASGSLYCFYCQRYTDFEAEILCTTSSYLALETDSS